MNSLEQLSVLLGKTVDTQSKLLDLEKRKADVIVSGSVQELDELMLQEQSLLMQVSGLEEQRESLQKTMGMAGMTLRSIIAAHDGENAFGLVDRFEELSRIITELQKINRLNMSILRSRLAVLDRLLVISGMKDPALTYEKPEQVKKGGHSRV